MPEPPHPAAVAAFDQLRAALADVAEALGGYREQLVAHGFDPDDALELCLDLQRRLIAEQLSPDAEPETA